MTIFSNISQGRGAARRAAAVVAGVFMLSASGPAFSADWATPTAERLGVTLEKSFDSTGPDAWDPTKHPNVFITSEGPGYGGLLSGVKLPGLAIIDADSRKPVTSANYDVLSWGWESVFEPHGLGVSPGGDWIYLPTGEGSFGTKGKGRLLIINAHTLKLDKVLHLGANAHHIKAFTRADGKPLVLVESFADGVQPAFVLDPADDNRVVGGWTLEDMGVNSSQKATQASDNKQAEHLGVESSYLNFVSPDGKEIWAGTGGHHMPAADPSATQQAAITRIDTMTWKPLGSIPVPDGNPVWVAFSADGKSAYVTGAITSRVFKVDRESNKITGYARAGVEGPYGGHLGWDDKILYVIGKGESSHNRGKVVGEVDTSRIGLPGGQFPMNQVVTNCVRGDHGTLNPNPDANELWITCNSSFEVVVMDLDRDEVVDRIAMPNGGSTHSGAFVAYDGWKGQVVSDQDGLQGAALAEKRKLLGLDKSTN